MTESSVWIDDRVLRSVDHIIDARTRNAFHSNATSIAAISYTIGRRL